MGDAFVQLCYVTNDFDRAIALLREMHAMGPFKEMRELELPTRPGHAAIGHFGLAFKEAVQFEVIEPLAGDVDLYRKGLPDDRFAMHFHHVGRHIPAIDEYRETLRLARERWSIVIDMAALGGHYAYTDARDTVGHYLEYFCFPGPDSPAAAPRY